jgi:hypothetical protein
VLCFLTCARECVRESDCERYVRVCVRVCVCEREREERERREIVRGVCEYLMYILENHHISISSHLLNVPDTI